VRALAHMCACVRVRLQVATGNSAGYVTVYDVSSRALMPVQRFFVDHGPVTHLAARVPSSKHAGEAARCPCVRQHHGESMQGEAHNACVC